MKNTSKNESCSIKNVCEKIKLKPRVWTNTRKPWCIQNDKIKTWNDAQNIAELNFSNFPIKNIIVKAATAPEILKNGIFHLKWSNKK